MYSTANCYNPEKQFEDVWKIHSFLIILGDWWENFRRFGDCSLAGLSKLISNCPQEHFREHSFGKIQTFCNHFRNMSGNFLAFWHIFSAGLSKLNYFVHMAFLGKAFPLFSNKFGLLSKYFPLGCQKCIARVRKNIFRKIIFLKKSHNF